MSEDFQKLVKMANQIALNIGLGATESDAVDKVADHIGRFWARPMRDGICLRLVEAKAELHPIAYKALEKVKEAL